MEYDMSPRERWFKEFLRGLLEFRIQFRGNEGGDYSSRFPCV